MDLIARGVSHVLGVRSSGPTLAALKMGLLFGAVGAIAGAASYSMRAPQVRSTDRWLTRRAIPTARERAQMRNAPVIYQNFHLLPDIAKNAELSVGIRCLFENAKISMRSIRDLMVSCDKLLAACAQARPASSRREALELKGLIQVLRSKIESSLADCLSQSGWFMDRRGLPINHRIADRISMLTSAIDSIAAAAFSSISSGTQSSTSQRKVSSDADADADVDADVDATGDDLDIGAMEQEDLGSDLETITK